MKRNVVEVKNFKIREVTVPIKGTSPLIVHAFSEKAKRQIEDKQQKKAKSSKHDMRDPQEEYEQAKHKSPLGFEGFPAAGFKAAMIRGAKIVGMVMKDAQTAFFVLPDCEKTQLVAIEGDPELHESMVRIGMGSADVRYRPIYKEWKAKLRIEYNEGSISVDQIYQLISAAGYGCGIGEMRPERGKFNYGRWEFDDIK